MLNKRTILYGKGYAQSKADMHSKEMNAYGESVIELLLWYKTKPTSSLGLPPNHGDNIIMDAILLYTAKNSPDKECTPIKCVNFLNFTINKRFW